MVGYFERTMQPENDAVELVPEIIPVVDSEAAEAVEADEAGEELELV